MGGTFNSNTQSKRAIVEFNHLTDFAIILDDPPATNKLASLRDTFDLSGWLQNNPVGLVLVVCFLTMIAIVATKNQRLYMQRNGLCLADQPWWHCRCSRHESTELQQAAILNTDYASSMYRYLKAVNEMDSIEYRLVQLRNNWNLGAILCPIPGDPHSRVERMLVYVAMLMIVLMCSIYFFNPIDKVVQACAHLFETGDKVCADWQCGSPDCHACMACAGTEPCPSNCIWRPNQLLALIISTLITRPLQMVITYSFGWLHRPELHLVTNQKSKDTLQRARRKLKMFGRLQKAATRVQQRTDDSLEDRHAEVSSAQLHS